MPLIDMIRWIKNVKRQQGTGWAYMEDNDRENFSLDFGPSHAAGADKPALGDVIVIFQTITDDQVAPPGTYLTHLVIVNSELAHSTNRHDYPRGRHVIVLARTEPPHALKSTEIGISFEDVNTGQLCNFDLFNKNKTPNENRHTIIDLFQAHF
jgi:hypothetical protein